LHESIRIRLNPFDRPGSALVHSSLDDLD
jgi:hypothetical protein